MTLFFQINNLIWFLSVFGILLIFLFNPLMIRLLSFGRRGGAKLHVQKTCPAVSIVIVVHNAGDLISAKLTNCLELNYPSDALQVVVYSDGSTDATEQKVREFDAPGILFLSHSDHEGKNISINRAVKHCSGEILLFSDADAMLERNALENLVYPFEDMGIGGVCGQRVLGEQDMELSGAQRQYVRFDSLIKQLESRTGSITSNDGKIYAIRKSLFTEVEQGVTDDLFACLSIVKQGYRFVFRSDARARVTIPSRNSMHEIDRRRRIVTRSLWGIYLNRAVLNPFSFGFYSVKLFINKILRRMLAFLLLLLFATSFVLASVNGVFFLFLLLQLFFYALAFSYHIFFRKTAGSYGTAKNKIMKSASVAYYFCVGNYGMMLGVIDFLRGRRVFRWEPLKKD